MKIAFDGKRFFNNSSGLGNYSRDLVRISAIYFPENEYLLFNENETIKGKDILGLSNVSFVKTSVGTWARQLKMGKDAQAVKADIFHGLSGELPLKWTDQPIKKVVTIHDLIFLRFPQFYSLFDRKIHLWKFKNAIKQADIIIAISEQTKRDVIQFLKVPKEKIRVVYQGCHQQLKEHQSDEYINLIKEKFQLPERFILNVGTIEERKNVLNIVKAINGTKIPLVVIGKKTNYFNKVKKYISKNKLENQVHFLENVSMEELAAIYKLADVFVYPSYFEGFGIPIIEALYSETPVITSNLSSLPEAGGDHSVYVYPNNVDDIKAKILFLWQNEAERKRRAKKGLKFVQKFNDESIAENLQSVYQELIFK